MFARRHGLGGNRDALLGVEKMVRARYGVGSGQIVLVSELGDNRPGFPRRHVVIQFWGEDGTRYRIVFFKPLADIALRDLLPRYMMPFLIDDGGECC